MRALACKKAIFLFVPALELWRWMVDVRPPVLEIWSNSDSVCNVLEQAGMLTPSLFQPVGFPGQKSTCACLQIMYFAVLWQIHFQCCALWWKCFHLLTGGRRKPKGFGISNFALLSLVTKWHRGHERVMPELGRNIVFYALPAARNSFCFLPCWFVHLHFVPQFFFWCKARC